MRTRTAHERQVLPSLPSFRDEGVPLVDLVDRLLETGVLVSGDVVVSVAGIDLVQLGLRAVLEGIDGTGPGARLPRPSGPHGSRPGPSASNAAGDPESSTLQACGRADDGPPPARGARIGIDPHDAERGLAQLVLTVVELLRQVLERQALRRLEADTVSGEDVERLGVALLRLHERMDDLMAQFGLTDDDLHLRLADVRDLG